MSAVEILKAARAAGVGITLDGDDLMLQASEQPPGTLLDALSRRKADIIALLKVTAKQPDRITAAMESKGTSWAEWKAATLNHLFQEQGLTGLPGRITAATIMHGAYSVPPQIPIDSDLDFGKGTTRPMSCAGRTAE